MSTFYSLATALRQALGRTLLLALTAGPALAAIPVGEAAARQPTFARDASVEAVYTLNKLPVGTPHRVRALVRNVGTSPISGVTVTLQVVGATSFTATTTVGANLAPNAATIVTFADFSPAAVGPQSLLLSLSADDDVSNNDLLESQEVTADTTSYVTPGLRNSTSLGFGGTGDRGFVARFTNQGARDMAAVRAYIADANTVGQTVYGVVVDPQTGALLGRTADYVVQAGDINTLHSFPFMSTVPLQGGDYLAGMAVVLTGGPQFFPMGLQAERPTRPGSFYTLALNPSSGPNDTGLSNFGKFMIEVVTAAPATCPTPTSVSLTGSSNSATLTFTGPANGTGYQLLYGPAGFNPTTAGTTVAVPGSPYTLTGLQSSTSYDFYLRALCGPADRSLLAGPFSYTTPCVPPIISTFPYTQDFNTVAAGQALPCGISVQDANADGYGWRARETVTDNTGNIAVGRGGSGNAMVYLYNDLDPTVGADDWFYTPSLALRAGQRYRLAFYYRASRPAFPEGLEVKYGNTAMPAGQTNLLFRNTNITSATYAAASNTSTPAVTDLTPAANGTFYIGFHAISAADQFFLAVDDVTITAVLGTSAALTRAVSVFPNPSNTGSFNLEIHNANAKQALGVEITNLLGQRVYSGTAKDNFTNKLDLSGLASGIYTLKVKNGSEYTMQQISIVK
jgi:hypothetical protein